MMMTPENRTPCIAIIISPALEDVQNTDTSNIFITPSIIITPEPQESQNINVIQWGITLLMCMFFVAFY